MSIHRTGNRSRRREAGVTMIAGVVAMTALIMAAALSIEGGMLWAARGQAQRTADATALGAAGRMFNRTNPFVPVFDAGAMRVGGEYFGERPGNSAVYNGPTVDVSQSDIVSGHWTFGTPGGTFTPLLADAPGMPINAARARVLLDFSGGDNAGNRPMPALLSRILGAADRPVSASAIAYLGGGAGTGIPPLPIAMDCCKMGTCDADTTSSQQYCNAVDNLPKCPLANGQMVDCLTFNPTGTQNACWIDFDPSSPAVSTPDLNQIIGDGGVDLNGDGMIDDIHIGDMYYTDNGDKTPVIRDIRDKFQGVGSYAGQPPAGSDRYQANGSPGQDGVTDSWVVALPVVDIRNGTCPNTDHCTGGDRHTIVGFVCFEIRQVDVTPEKIIRGHFLCPTKPADQPLFADCALSGDSGGTPTSPPATIPKLVN
jgi:Putative Tad-like Flp pilus-assembly